MVSVGPCISYRSVWQAVLWNTRYALLDNWPPLCGVRGRGRQSCACCYDCMCENHTGKLTPWSPKSCLLWCTRYMPIVVVMIVAAAVLADNYRHLQGRACYDLRRAFVVRIVVNLLYEYRGCCFLSCLLCVAAAVCPCCA